MLKILLLSLAVATQVLGGNAAAAPAETPSPPVAAPPAAALPSVRMPGFHSAAGRHELHMTGSNGAQINLIGEGPVDAAKLKLFEAEVRKEVERTITFDLRWEEAVTPAEGGGVTLLRILRTAKVERLIGGKLEAGPLPIDYQDAVLEISLNADGRMTRRKFTAPRLVEAEREILEQFFEVEPFPELPAMMAPGERVERLTRQLIPSENHDAPPTSQVTTDRYQLAGAAELSSEKLAAPAGGATLRLDRDSLIEGAGDTFNPIRTLGKFWLTLDAAGRVTACHGSYEQSYTEILAAPPELLSAQPAPAAVAPAAGAKPASAPAASAAAPPVTPAPAVLVTPLPEGKVQWVYHLPGRFSLSRRTLAGASVIQAPGDPALPKGKSFVGQTNSHNQKDVSPPPSAAPANSPAATADPSSEPPAAIIAP